MTVGGMDSFFMSSAQVVYRNLCRAIASEFNNKGPVNKIDKNMLHISGCSLVLFQLSI